MLVFMESSKGPGYSEQNSELTGYKHIDNEAAEQRFNTIVSGFIDGASCLEVVYDSAGEVIDFVITDINQAAAQFFDQPKEELVGQLLSEVIPPHRTQFVLPRVTEVFLSGKSKEIEEDLWVGETQHQIIQQLIPFSEGVFAIVKDVTESRLAQAALRDSQEYLSSVIANAPIIIYELDCDGNFKLSAGRSLIQIGLRAGEAVGQSIFDFFNEDSPEVTAFLKALNGETVTTQTQLANGYFTSRYTPRFDEQGEIVGVLGVSYDITEQHLAEQKLQQAQRLEAVGQLTGGIAHDFNNLLAVIIGNLDLLSIKAELSDEAQGLIEQAIGASQRGSMLTKRLLAFSRQQVLQPQRTNVTELLNGMIGLLERTFSENIDIKCEAPTQLWDAHIDPSQLENAVLNLCVNARDAMPNGGQLRIIAENRSVADATDLSLQPGDYVRISVIDNGCGIAEDVQKLVFEPFFSTKEAGKGSGLGLSMVYGFVEQSGGAVLLDSKLGDGSRFDIYLPRSHVDHSDLTQPRGEDSIAIQGRGERVLVVEDDNAVRDLVVKVLASLNYKVEQADNAEEALKIIENQPDIDVLFSDIVLPGKHSGIQLARLAQTKFPRLKILMTTGYARGSDQVDMASLPQLQLIRKPFQIEQLGRQIRMLLDQ